MGEGGGGGGGVRTAKCHMRISNFKVSKHMRWLDCLYVNWHQISGSRPGETTDHVTAFWRLHYGVSTSHTWKYYLQDLQSTERIRQKVSMCLNMWGIKNLSLKILRPTPQAINNDWFPMSLKFSAPEYLGVIVFKNVQVFAPAFVTFLSSCSCFSVCQLLVFTWCH